MSPSLPLIVAMFAAPAATLPTDVWQVAPDPHGKPGWLAGTGRKDRAVLLIPGLKLHPLRPNRITRPELHDWQEPKSELVKVLARDSDVFAFGYAQTTALDVVAHSTGMGEIIAQLRQLGYSEIVLIGHSAGGVVARQFAECYPQSGVTKVVQVAAPNMGSEVASVFKTGYSPTQAPFVQSLTPAARIAVVRDNRKFLGPKFEFACVACKVPAMKGDGLVPLSSQWPEDLQQQGVPAVRVLASHFDAMKSDAAVRTIALLAREPLTRWTPDQVDTARKVIFRENDDKK